MKRRTEAREFIRVRLHEKEKKMLEHADKPFKVVQDGAADDVPDDVPEAGLPDEDDEELPFK